MRGHSSERFSRVTHSAGFPRLAVAWCLANAGLSAAELDHVAIGRDPRANLRRKLIRTLMHGATPRYVKGRLANAARVPIVLNTFNENEPIVMTLQDAVSCFLDTRMDLLVLGNHVVDRPG